MQCQSICWFCSPCLNLILEPPSLKYQVYHTSMTSMMWDRPGGHLVLSVWRCIYPVFNFSAIVTYIHNHQNCSIFLNILLFLLSHKCWHIAASTSHFETKKFMLYINILGTIFLESLVNTSINLVYFRPHLILKIMGL